MDWAKISGRLKAARHRLYLFDVDGTLASIKKKPQMARIDGSLRRLLYELSVKPRTSVGIVSGRQLDDAKVMVGLQNLIYAGNHGLEVYFNGVRKIQPQARKQIGALQAIRRRAEREFAAVPGALVEWKGLTMSVHYRLVNKRNKAKFDEILESLTPVIRRRNFQIRQGKKVAEIVPSGSSNKGIVVEMLRKSFPKPMTIFTGDDVTDEDAFNVLGPRDVSVRVGRKNGSKAVYYLKNQREVKDLLRHLVKLRC